MSSITRIFNHAFKLTKAVGVAWYNGIYYWAQARASQTNPEHCFSSSMIYLSDPKVKQNRKYLHRGYDHEKNSNEMIDRVIANTMVTYDGMLSLVDQSRFCEEHNIPGSFVELGTWKGGCLGLMAQANFSYGRTRRMLHGFDSFEGLPAPREDEDFDSNIAEAFKITREQADGSLSSIGALLSDQTDVERLLNRIGYPREYIKLHKGWFQKTVPTAAETIGPIAILRLDGDLYDSYMIPLRHLYNLVVPGGFIIIDDWMFRGCRNAVRQFLAERGSSEYICYVDGTVRFIRKMSAG